jgi:DNA (cytosine-5)-methyltransferase 1
MNELTHASFFSGVGGLDLGLERAGWRTVSFSEIDPYASAVLAERWPGVPNLGDITVLHTLAGDGRGDAGLQDGQHQSADEAALPQYPDATLWSGGFPCQDLSVAGKRAGFAGARSSLAFAFLNLVERHRPPAILLENVPGLLSSHRGRDFGALLDRLAQLGYGWAYRILDARHFGVPQRRRRVFIVALNLERGLGADSAAAVLSVGTRCPRHPATGHATGEGVARGAGDGPELVGTIPAGLGHHGNGGHSSQAVNSGHVIAGSLKQRDGKSVDAEGAADNKLVVGAGQSVARAIHASTGRRSGPAGDEVSNLVHAIRPGTGDGGSWERGDADYILSPAPDPGGVRAPDGLAGRVDDRPLAYRKSARPVEADGSESWVDDGLANTLNSFDTGDIRSTHIALGQGPADDPLLPLGLDSHRYRCCGNGVVSSVAEWIGTRLAEVLA